MSGSNEQSIGTKIQKAADGHYYIHVFRKDGSLKTSHIKLTGFKQMFEKDPEFMYVFSLRHAGKASDLLEYMTRLGFAESDVRTYMQDSYTAANATSMSANISTELNSIPVVKKESKRKVSLDEIIALKPHLDSLRSVKAAPEEMPAPSTPKATASRSKTDLKSRLDALDEGKVLDITHYDASKNNGIKTSKRTVKGSRRPLAASGDLNRVVFDFEKSVDVALAALVSMGMTETQAKHAMSAAQVSKPASLAKIAISPRK
jgi:hypothetical protein